MKGMNTAMHGKQYHSVSRIPRRTRQVNETASDEDDYYNYYYNYVDSSGAGDSVALSSTSSHYDYLLPKLDQLTAPTDTLIRDLIILKHVHKRSPSASSSLCVELIFWGRSESGRGFQNESPTLAPRLLRNKRKYAKWRQKQKRIRQNQNELWLRQRQRHQQQQQRQRQRQRLHHPPPQQRRRRPPPRPEVGHPSLEVTVVSGASSGGGGGGVVVGSRQDFAPDGNGNYEVRMCVRARVVCLPDESHP